jgi:hypothetical protein
MSDGHQTSTVEQVLPLRAADDAWHCLLEPFPKIFRSKVRAIRFSVLGVLMLQKQLRTSTEGSDSPAVTGKRGYQRDVAFFKIEGSSSQGEPEMIIVSSKAQIIPSALFPFS